MPRPKSIRSRRHYSDVFRAEALACLDANGGNIERTARELSMPTSTLEGWAKGLHSPVSPKLRDQKRRETCEALEAWIGRLTEINLSRVKKDSTIADFAVAMGIAVDKLLLLRDIEVRQAQLNKSKPGIDLSSLTFEEVTRFYDLQRKAAGLPPRIEKTPPVLTRDEVEHPCEDELAENPPETVIEQL